MPVFYGDTFFYPSTMSICTSTTTTSSTLPIYSSAATMTTGAAYARARAEATARARALLLSFLSPEQRADFEATKCFIVIGKSGTRYRIRRGHIGNVDVMRGKSGDYVVHRLCFHPDNDRELPVYDTMLAQMLHLRADDAAVRRIANVS